jgi:hypothetical protein
MKDEGNGPVSGSIVNQFFGISAFFSSFILHPFLP